MILRYGSYTHAYGECSVNISATTKRSQDGKAMSTVVQWDIGGMLQAADASAMTSAINALATAYSTDSQEAVWYTEGSQESAHTLKRNSNLIGIIRVTRRPSFPQGNGYQYTTIRNYAITLEAEYTDVSGYSFVSWEESVSIQGNGGILWKYLYPIIGQPQAQQLQQYTPITIQQSGRAVGVNDYPPAGDPLYPTQLLNESPKIDRSRRWYSNERITAWSYTFSLTSLPTVSPKPILPA